MLRISLFSSPEKEAAVFRASRIFLVYSGAVNQRLDNQHHGGDDGKGNRKDLS